MGSGSSAVTDLLKEYNNVNTKNGSFEYIFLHCPNGVFDLEDKLLKNNNSLRSDEALREFKETMKDLYSRTDWWFANYRKKLSKEFYEYCENYVRELTDFEFDGLWYYQQKTNYFKSFSNLFLSFFNNHFHTNFKRIRNYNNMIVSFKSESEFYEISKKFINSIIDLINDDKKENVVLDQLLLPQNLDRLNKYFENDTVVIVVKRDPRDIFFLNKYVWDKKNIRIPIPLEKESFCDYYEKMMLSFKNIKDKKVLYINFEDLVYNYDDAVLKIERLCKLDDCNHVYKKNYLNPDISINNTNIYRDYYVEEREYISRRLSEYLYDFKEIRYSKDGELF